MKKPHIILGICGGISAYKTPELIRNLVKDGYRVTPILTKNALQFVTQTTIETVAQEEALLETAIKDNYITHLSVAKSADGMIIAPATANHIAKFAHGFADTLLSTTFLSFTGPKLLVPAMHTEMYDNPITQNNIQKLLSFGIDFLGPDYGDLACKDIGTGRMVDIELIQQRIASLFLPKLPLKNKQILITAGGTSEPIDAVRHISNASSGKLGHTLATLASFYGANVSLISSKNTPHLPQSIKKHTVRTVKDLETQLSKEISDCDALFMAAAVSDFTIKEKTDRKLKRDQNPSLQLEKTNDLLKSIGEKKEKKQQLIGFCLEEESKLDSSAQKKLKEKHVDYIIANTPTAIGKDTRSFKVYSKEGLVESHDNKPLLETAHTLLSLLN
ncbi:bifunctional phosphopantothenoylcysteine decarboxylase/phosphopantothenate--cysteine ligase CoaBC [Candidatus Marinamargulisbacteria bacterium SCGC AG-439-L15]|nr:bifunctional phosphopantothenoylcysteine decarboxylase/phosphopantothenate--cysteine ligase CoaBC [Candidatus Marinamargulisbacteria bacterium SCGC AG-439-L15]